MWLETVVLIEAAATFWLASLNLLLLGRSISQARGRARRLAASVLACASGGQSLEALLFLWQGAISGGSGVAAAVLLVRSVLMLSTGLISLLLVRALSLRR